VIVSFDFGRTQWLPSFFIRKYAVGTTELGFWLTVIYGLGGAIALYGGGELASRYAAKNERLQLRLASIAYIAAGVGWVAICLSSRVVYYYGEDSNVTALYAERLPPVPQGYAFDFASADALSKLSVKDGLLVTASGMS
jgi:hypothetical protein